MFIPGKTYRLLTDLSFECWSAKENFLLQPNTCLLFLYKKEYLGMNFNHFFYDNKIIWRCSLADHFFYEEFVC